MIKTRAEVEALVLKTVTLPIRAIVHYGSRVRGQETKHSDWDVVVLVEPQEGEPKEERVVLGAELVDMLVIDCRIVSRESWAKREICAILMSDASSVWSHPELKPHWNVDWDAIIKEKERRTRGAITHFLKNRPASTELKRKHCQRIRRWAQRVEWMREFNTIPSTPELDRKWVTMTWKEKNQLIEKFGGDGLALYM